MVRYVNKELQFVWLWQACKRYLDHASENRPGRFYDYMTTMIYASFLIESYLNEVGDHLFDNWQAEYDRKSVKDKIKQIGKALNAQFELGNKPFQYIDEMMDYRNLVVHSKAQNLSEEVSNERACRDDYSGPRSEMDQLASLDSAKRFLSQAEMIVNTINKRLPKGRNEHPILRPDECPFVIASIEGSV